MQHVIIGAGPAGVVAAEHLRKLDPDSKVALIGDEPEPPYSRMAIPYYLIKQVDEVGTYLRKDAHHYAERGIDVIQDRVTGIDTGKQECKLEKGGSISYDKLLIATGSHPFSPPVPGIESPGVYPCWTLADAREIIKLAQAGNKVVLMGAGFIGCIILEALATSGVDLTVVEMENRMVPRMMNETSGNMIKDWCSSKGVAVHTSTKVDAIEPGSDGRALRVLLDNGNTLAADLVISATGVRSNIDFLEATNVDTDFGILVNHHLQTNDPNVYAAGDVAQGKDFSTGEYSVQAIQPTAADHGRIAASNMAGRVQIHQGSVNMNVLDTMGLISSSFGMWMGVDGGDSVELHDPGRFRYLNLQFQDDVLVGASSLGLTEHIGVLRGLIQSRVKLNSWKEKLKEDPTRVMEAYIANTQAIGHNAHVL
ncbi:MAG: FAD-dependent oxidoreductase [Gammaproteobacteria bacterium]|nr:FAD-dependent oxidoreductase [Gammaproteobacteria bacterium]